MSDPIFDLATYAGSADLKGVKNIQVTLTCFVDTGRPDQTSRPFRILTPRPLVSLLWTSKRYALTVRSGNILTPTYKNNVIDVAMKVPDEGIYTNQIRFEMACDGTPDWGYIFSVRQSGPPVTRFPGNVIEDPAGPNNYLGYSGIRYDLIMGNEDDSATPQTDKTYLHSWFQGVDVNLVDSAKQKTSDKDVYRQASFS